ncbi:unnamed protein product [Clonostachys solani]|uniref:Polysaccharide lyase n=1 Tax=Clonostachys solani TaxID=160281 RepID=A0A9N9WAD1_9HYPO|nr:unnamed protein product [Clonostachys solani]
MIFQKTFAAAALALLPQLADATRLFYNSGTVSGWSGDPFTENKGTVAEVTNVYSKGPTALKMTQTYDSSWKGRYHSEVRLNDGYKTGDERAYAFSFRLSESWQIVNEGYNIAQFIADLAGACDDWMPSTMIWIEGNQLVTRYVNGNYVVPECKRSIQGSGKIATVTPGKWHRVIVEAKWKNDSTGYLKLWFDGKVVWEKNNIATTIKADKQFQFRVGLYANSWQDGMEGSQPFRQIWYDEVAVGTTLADVQ